MKILGMDFLHWVFPKTNNSFVELMREKGVEFKYIQPDVLYRNTRKILAFHKHSIADPYYKGYNIRNMIKVEMVKETHWYKWNKNIENDYVLRVMGLIDWTEKIYKEEKPDYILIEGGLTCFARVTAEIAREMGIKIITVENSFIDGRIFMDFSTGFVVNRHIFARCSQDWMDTRYLTHAKRKEVDKIITDVFQNLKFKTKDALPMPKFMHSKTIFAPLQVTGDQVCVYDSKYNNEKFVKELIWLANNKFQDWNVVLRCHPVEERWSTKAYTGNWVEKQKLPSNVYLLRGAFDSYNTQQLIKNSDLILVNNSQAGLEACLLEKPVMVLGDAFYHNKGFTTTYKRTHNWEKIKENPDILVNADQAKLWFLYFYKWLFNKQFTEIDKQRVLKEMNIERSSNEG